MQVDIKDKLYNGILAYCHLNELNFNDYINELLKKQFAIDRYGEKPMIRQTTIPDKVETITESKPKKEYAQPMVKIEIKESVAEEPKPIMEKEKKIVKKVPTIKKVIKKPEVETKSIKVEPVEEIKKEEPVKKVIKRKLTK